MAEPRHRRVDISAVVPGMQVVDRSGRAVGSVTLVQPGNADTSPPPEREDEGGGVLETLVDLLSEGEPRVPSHLAGPLQHTGYLKIQASDGAGPETRHVYCSARDVVSVEDDTVHLAREAGELVGET